MNLIETLNEAQIHLPSESIVLTSSQVVLTKSQPKDFKVQLKYVYRAAGAKYLGPIFHGQMGKKNGAYNPS